MLLFMSLKSAKYQKHFVVVVENEMRNLSAEVEASRNQLVVFARLISVLYV